MSSIVTVGLLSVEIFEGKSTAIIAVGGPRSVAIDVGAATGKRFFDELTKLREALLAADAVSRDDQAPSGPVTKSEVRLASLLLELGVDGALDHVDGAQPQGEDR